MWDDRTAWIKGATLHSVLSHVKVLISNPKNPVRTSMLTWTTYWFWIHLCYDIGLAIKCCYDIGLLLTPFLFSGGPIHVYFPSGLTLAQVARKNPLVVRGGRYRPPDCEARHRTAIIIPHRNREHHLKFLLYYLHPFLQRQQLNYGIYVIHQVKCICAATHFQKVHF